MTAISYLIDKIVAEEKPKRKKTKKRKQTFFARRKS